MLLSSELVANAMHHAGSPCRLSVTVSERWVRVEAADADSAPPVLERRPLDSAGGRGLVLLDAMASAWGSTGDAENGKTRWFELVADRYASPRSAQRAEGNLGSLGA